MPDNDKMLKIKKEMADINKMYSEDKRQQSFNLLLLGEKGTGKTLIARTCRFPTHIDSFDPGGTKHLRKEISEGKIIVDSRFETEDPQHPKAYRMWNKSFKERMKMGYFDQIGTYMLDSASTWGDAILNWVMQKDGLAGTVPRFTKDFQPQKIEIRNMIKLMCDLPCDFILTGHLAAEKDEVSGKITNRFLTTGKGVVTIPLLFDELYVMTTKATASGVDYRLLTARTGTDLAATRIGEGKFNLHEEPNIKALLKKAGMPCDDKELLLKGGDVESNA